MPMLWARLSSTGIMRSSFCSVVSSALWKDSTLSAQASEEISSNAEIRMHRNLFISITPFPEGIAL